MNEYQGEERRAADPWRDLMEERMDRIEKAVTCVRAHNEEFSQTYGLILKETLESRASRAKLWAIATEELVKKGVWAALVFLCGAVLVGSREYLKRWLMS